MNRYHPDARRCICGGSGYTPGLLAGEDDPCPLHAHGDDEARREFVLELIRENRQRAQEAPNVNRSRYAGPCQPHCMCWLCREEYRTGISTPP